MNTVPVRLTTKVHQHAKLGAALHGLSVDDFFNTVVSSWIVAANAVLLTQPARDGAVKNALTTLKGRG